MKLTNIHAVNFKLLEFNTKLTGRDIFTGPNGIGKSARLQAVQVALFNHIPKVGKQPSATMGYAVDETEKMLFSAKSEKLEIHRKFRKKVSKKTLKVDCSSELDLVPLGIDDKEAAIRENFGLTSELVDISLFKEMTANQRKDHVAKICAGKVSVNAKKKISGSCDMSLWNDQLLEIENINLIEEHYKTKLSEAKKSLKTLKARAKEAPISTEDLVTDSPEKIQKDIDKAQEKIEELTTDKAAADSKKSVIEEKKKRKTSTQEDIDTLQGQIDDKGTEKDVLKSKMAKMKEIDAKAERVKSLEKKVADLKKKVEDLRLEYQAAKVEQDLHTKMKELFKDANCPFIKNVCPESKILLDELKKTEGDSDQFQEKVTEAVGKGKKAADSLEAALKLLGDEGDENTALVEELKSFDDDLDWIAKNRPGVEKKIKGLNKEITDINKEISETKAVDTKMLDTTLTATRQKIKDLQAKKDRAVSQTGGKVDIEKAKIAVIDKEEEVEKLDDILSLLGNDGIKGDMAKKSHQPLLDAMNKVLEPINQKADIIFDRDNKASFDICLKRDGKSVVMEVLSDGQQILLVMAFVCAIQEMSNSPCKLLMIEASELDDTNFSAMITALNLIGENIDNIMIARYRLDDKPKGWEVHELG